MATSFDYKDLTHISNLLLPLRNESSHSKGHRSQNVYLLRNVFSCCHLQLNGFVDDLHIIAMSLLLQLIIQNTYDFRSIKDNGIMNKCLIIYFPTSNQYKLSFFYKLHISKPKQ